MVNLKLNLKTWVKNVSTAPCRSLAQNPCPWCQKLSFLPNAYYTKPNTMCFKDTVKVKRLHKPKLKIFKWEAKSLKNTRPCKAWGWQHQALGVFGWKRTVVLQKIDNDMEDRWPENPAAFLTLLEKFKYLGIYAFPKYSILYLGWKKTPLICSHFLCE